MDVDFDHLSGQCLSDFSTYGVTFSSFPHCTLVEKATVCSHMLGVGTCTPPPLGQSTEHLHKLFRIFLHGRFVYPPHFQNSIIYSYQFEHMDIYFVLWIIIKYYFTYFVIQIVPALAIHEQFVRSVESLVVLTNTQYFEFFFFFLGTIRCNRLILYSYCLSLKIGHFFKKLCSLLLKKGSGGWRYVSFG